MKNLREKPIYLEFPLLQIIYITCWIPAGFAISKYLGGLTVIFVFNILAVILKSIYSFAFELFVFSGRFGAMMPRFTEIAIIAFDIILLVIGLEIISHFLSKKRVEGGWNV